METAQTKFEDTYSSAKDAFGSLEGKKGFELYQAYRDALISLLYDTSAGPQKFSQQFFEESDIFNLDLIDQKYLDNFILCAHLRIKSPENYDELKEIIDKNIQPDPRSAGWTNVYKQGSRPSSF